MSWRRRLAVGVLASVAVIAAERAPAVGLPSIAAAVAVAATAEHHTRGER